ncbi:ATP-binding protein [Oryzihumus leptocrescens]|uniref:AAA domain-containing protein n=1 Tax=Oryzihumus leptocrescens TaxID=297536 RepID=A0A542ZEQ8_9MICO|nr:ATP-binding protein [Oryzihumus leptocrescens]TQL58797.1 AAA domain-containing protein [Oryzihumus leptocrescens]
MGSTSGLALRRISGHCTVTAEKIHAWYLLDPQGWSFRPDPVREQLIIDGADAYAQLVKRSLHLRVTTRPYPVSTWAAAHDANAPAPLPAWRDYLMRDQHHLAGRSMADKEVYVGVEIPARKGLYKALGGLAGSLSDREVAALSARIRETDEIMSAPGMDGSPATPRQLEWLLHRSCSLGLPAPLTIGAVDDPHWESEDLGEFTDHVRWTAIPYGRTIRVVGENDTQRIERHVCILSVGRMTDLEIPSGVPWMQRTDQLGFPVEWSGRVEIEDSARVGAAMRRSIQKIRAQKDHYELEHAEPAPGALDRQADKALAVEDEISMGLSGLSTRTRGWFRLAVSAPTEEEALERASAVRKLFAPQITIARPADQYAVAREFIPGERLGSTAYRRRMPVTTLAAAVPAATAKVGDRVGIHLGETSGTSSRVVTWEPWEMTERGEESGLAVLCAGLGGGKSTAGGNIIYRSLLQGVPWTVLDPSGRLTALCRLAELADHARAVDLLDAPAGVLCTYRVIAEPRREHYASELDWRTAQDNAADTRRLLTSSVLRSMLPRQMQDHVLTEVALMRAVGRVRATNTASTMEVVEELAVLDGDPELRRHSGYMADFLREAAKTSHGRLIFPAGYHHDYAHDEPLLTVYSLRGLALPDENTPYSDDLDERLSMCVLYLAAWLTQRGMYFGDVHARKGIFIDEAWALSTFSTGRRFIDRASRDSRKHNTRVLLASQNPSDLLDLGLANLISAAFIGRLTDEGAQQDALRFLPGVREGVGYEAIFGTLSRPSREGRRGAREFVFSDGIGGIERIRMDMSAHPDLLEALSTTADPEKARNRLGRHRTDSLPEAPAAPADDLGEESA